MKAGSAVVAAARRFAVAGELLSAEAYGSGHINDSYRVVFREGGVERGYLLQRINTQVFTDPAALMENVERVARHIAGLVCDEPDGERRTLTLIPAQGRALMVDEDGDCWRMMRFIDGAHAPEWIAGPEQAFEIAAAFGKFQHQLASLPPPRLNDTIRDFHNTPKRFADLERAIETDAAGRVKDAMREIAFARSRERLCRVLLDARLPERVTHNDTKGSNVLLDDVTGEGLCVIDLDTVMPGLALYDFGDMVRSMASPAAEDERDLSRVAVDVAVFEALARGYLSTAGDMLTREEKGLLVEGGKLITFENGLRFLSDYLNGDTYYKTEREGQNLDRCRTQFRLVESLEQNEGVLGGMVEGLG